MLHRIVLLGEGGVGKTAIAMQFCLSQFVETYDPTIEDSYRKQMVVDEEACQVELLDTAGQDEFVALRDQWIRDGHGFLLIYSATSRATLDQIEKLHESICRVKESNRNAVLVIGNKADRTAEIEVRKELGASVAKKINAEFLETSAKTGLNIEKAFVEVIRLVRALEAEKESGSGLGRTGTGKSIKQKSKKNKAKCLIL